MKGKKGFTLLEVIISLLLLTVGIIGFLCLVGVGLQSSKRAGDITEASFLAREEMVKFQANRSLLTVGSGTFTGGQYEIKASGLNDNLYFVKVEALDGQNNVITSLSTYLYKPSG